MNDVIFLYLDLDLLDWLNAATIEKDVSLNTLINPYLLEIKKITNERAD